MARSADPPSNNHHSPETSGDGADSPVLRWAQVVRGEPDSISSSAAAAAAAHQSPSSSSSSLSSLAPSSPPPTNNSSSSSAAAAAAAENPDGTNNSSIGFRKKKPAWSKPSNGVVVASGGGSVMGGPDSWPALSESARASPKQLGSADSSLSTKPLADGSISDSQGPVKINSPRKQASSNNANPNLTLSHPLPTRQRSMRRGGGGGPPPAHSNFVQPPPPPPPQTPPMQPPPPPFPVFQLPPPNAFGNVISVLPDYSPRDPSFRRPPAGFMGQSQLVNDPRNSARRGNFGHHNPHGEGAYHNNYGSRRDQDRGNYGNAMDAHVPPQRAPPPRGFVRHAPPNTPFISPPMRHYNSVGFPDFVLLHPSIIGGPYMPPIPPSPMPTPVVEPTLPVLIVNQIEYYFSDANLVKDEFLRSKMDHQGWVPISLIASFPRVKNLTPDVQIILNSLRASTVVEVQDDKVRRRNDWMKWVPTSGRLSTLSGSVSLANSSHNLLASSFQQITLDEGTPRQNSGTSKAEDPEPQDGPENCSTETGQLANGELTQNTHSS